MRVNIAKFLAESGIEESFYPGKRLVKPCRQEGQFKSHCAVLDWRTAEKIRFEVKPGLSGKTLPTEDLKKYPVSFQSPTYVELDVVNDNKDDEDEEEGKGKASGGGGKGQKKKSLKDVDSMISAFGDVTEGKIPELGDITEMVVMGMKIAEEAYGAVLETLANQINHAKLCGTELMAKAGDFVTKYMPPSFMEPKGDEKANYNYDREKNADIGMRAPSVG